MLDRHSLTPPMTAYVAKLERRVALSPEDREALLSLPFVLRQVEPQRTIVTEGQNADHSIFLIEGLVSRQRASNRAQQIISISFPGDAVDLQTLFFHNADHALVAHVPTTIASVLHGAIIELCNQRPSLAQVLWHDTLVDSAIFREWAMNIGHRRAPDRIGYLLLEFEARLAAIGQAKDGVFRLHLTQQELASAVGLSLVHMNKSLRRLRDAGWIATQGREIRIVDREGLKKAVGFTGDYLHLAEAPAFRKPRAMAA